MLKHSRRFVFPSRATTTRGWTRPRGRCRWVLERGVDSRDARGRAWMDGWARINDALARETSRRRRVVVVVVVARANERAASERIVSSLHFMRYNHKQTNERTNEHTHTHTHTHTQRTVRLHLETTSSGFKNPMLAHFSSNRSRMVAMSSSFSSSRTRLAFASAASTVAFMSS